MKDDPDWLAHIVTEIGAIYVPHERFVGILAALSQRLLKEPPHKDKKSLLVTGPSGAGKSTVIDKFEQSWPRVSSAIVREDAHGGGIIADHVPILRASVPPELAYTALGRRILYAYGDPKYDKGSGSNVNDRVDTLIMATKTRGILLDDAQRLVDRSGTVIGWNAVEFMKDRTWNTGVAFALFGLERTVRLIDQDQQIKRRWTRGHHIKPFEWDYNKRDSDWPTQEKWISALAAFQRECPLTFDPQLQVTEIVTEPAIIAAGRMHYALRGLLGMIKVLLISAAEIMERERRQQSTLSLALLYRAYDEAFGADPRHVNPFSPAWKPELRTPGLEQDDFSPNNRRSAKRSRRSDRVREAVSRLTVR